MSLGKTRNFGEARIALLAITPDQLYGIALCERHNHGELHFGRIESRTAVIFDTKTLKILAEVPLDKDLYPEFAIWQGNGKIVPATDSRFERPLTMSLQTTDRSCVDHDIGRVAKPLSWNLNFRVAGGSAFGVGFGISVGAGPFGVMVRV